MRPVYLLIIATTILIFGGCGQYSVHKAIRQSIPSAEQDTSVLAVYQPWFGSPEHINVGYSSSDVTVLQNQIRKAKDFGIDGFVVDWYGNNRKDFDRNYALLQETAANADFKVALMYDEPKGDPEDSTQQAIVALDYAYDKYIGPKAANRHAYVLYNGRPIIFIWPNSARTDWNIVRQHVEQWELPPLLITRFDTAKDPQAFDGFYAWVDTGKEGWSPDGRNWGKEYLDRFYTTMKRVYPNKIIVTGAWAGFDDSKAHWGTHRKIDSRCGKTFQDTLTEFHRNVSPEHPIPFLLIETWNDYEEGTAIERGIAHCTSDSALSADRVDSRRSAKKPSS